MKIILTGQQTNQFFEDGHVLFQGAVPPKRIEALLGSLTKSEGRDLWRTSEEAERFARQPLFRELAEEFSEEPLILGADQLFTGTQYEGQLKPEQFLSIRGKQLLFLVRLKGVGEEGDLLPPNRGDLLLLNDQVTLPMGQTEGLFYIVSYADLKALYVQGEADSHKNYFKGLGYVIGDRLSDHGHPFVKR